MKTNTFLMTLLLALLFYGCTANKEAAPVKLNLFIAASLTNVISDITHAFEDSTGIMVNLNTASSGTLARQISEGANCDLYLSANKKWMDFVEKRHLIKPQTICQPAKNSLVLIGHTTEALHPNIKATDLPGTLKDRLSLGDPAHVPAGKYAVQTLKSLHLFQDLSYRILPAKDARSALMVVEMGECQYGLVYKTDALKSGKITILEEFPDSLHDPIRYYGAIGIKAKKQTELLLKFINNEASKKTWQDYGFIQ